MKLFILLLLLASFTESGRVPGVLCPPYVDQHVCVIAVAAHNQGVDFAELKHVEAASTSFWRALRTFTFIETCLDAITMLISHDLVDQAQEVADFAAEAQLGLIPRAAVATHFGQLLSQRALELYPSFLPAHLAFGVAAARARHFELAITQFHQVLSVQPHHCEALLELGNTMFQVGDAAESLQLFR